MNKYVNIFISLHEPQKGTFQVAKTKFFPVVNETNLYMCAVHASESKAKLIELRKNKRVQSAYINSLVKD